MLVKQIFYVTLNEIIGQSGHEYEVKKLREKIMEILDDKFTLLSHPSEGLQMFDAYVFKDIITEVASQLWSDCNGTVLPAGMHLANRIANIYRVLGVRKSGELYVIID